MANVAEGFAEANATYLHWETETDKSRRNLLLSAVTGLFIVITNAVPTKIAAVGVEFSQVQQSQFLCEKWKGTIFPTH